MSYSLNNITNPTYTVSANTVTSGAYLMSSGTGSSTWATIASSTDLKGASLEVHGDAKFTEDVDVKGDLKLQGKSLKDSLDRIEERLAILRPNEELEEKWDQLRGLRKMYMELEAEIKEKEAMWAILKK
jgi:predicted nuclease with TOPRIM domain